MDHPCYSSVEGFDIPYALSANDDDKLLLAVMMENARNNWSIGGDNVDNLFAAIAVMLMLTVVPNMIFNAWRIRHEQKTLANRDCYYDQPHPSSYCISPYRIYLGRSIRRPRDDLTTLRTCIKNIRLLDIVYQPSWGIVSTLMINQIQQRFWN